MNDKWLRIAGLAVTMMAGIAGDAWAAGPLDSWQAGTLGTFSMTKVAFGNGVFLAPGNKTGFITWGIKESTDGVAWSTVSFQWVQAPAVFAYANGTYVMGTNDGAVLTSTDAKQWTGRLQPVSSVPVAIRALAFGNGTWMAIGNMSYVTSTDLVTWTPHNLVIAGATAQANSLAVLGSTFVATVAGAITSFDGTSWTTRFTATGGWAAVAANPSGFVAVGYGGVVATSADGITWTQRPAVGTSPANAGIRLTDVTYGAGGWVAIGTSTGGPALYSSTDGIAWTSHAIPANGASLESVAFGGGRYVVTARDSANQTTSYASGVYTAPFAGRVTTVLTNPTPTAIPTSPATAPFRKP